jgi:TRAP-type C4-dicarboxylate transport system permease small subunit
MSGLYKTLKHIYDNVATAMFVVVIGCVLLQILARYVIQVSIPWTEELARYMLVINAFLGTVIAFRKGGHLGAYFLRDKSTGRLRGFFYTFNSVIVLCVLVLLFFGALKMRFAVAGLDASTMQWFRQSWLYDAALIGIFLMFCYGVRDLYFSVLALLGKKEITGTGCSCPEPEGD